MNKFIVSGVLAKDPELNSFNKTGQFCKFTLANNVKVKVGDTYEDKTTFFNIVAFGKKAEIIKNHWHKGDNMLCECEITENNYERDGKKFYGFSFVLVNLDFFGKQKSKSTSNKEPEANSPTNIEFDDDEIPF